jgi:soluble cytochrome b562
MELTATNLKQALWDTLQSVKSGKTNAAEADSIATQAREILRTTNTQLQIFRQSKRNVSTEVIDFAEK